jgi:integrase
LPNSPARTPSPAATPAAAAPQLSTSSPHCDASTSTPSTTGSSAPTTTPPPASANPADNRACAKHYPNERSPTSSRSPPNLLILRLHLETACRQGGALHAHRQDLDTDQCLIRLHEKGQTQRWQPISPTLTRALVAHFDTRGDGNPSSQILRYRNGRPVGKRRYDNIWKRIRTHLRWADTHQISAHWLRHTTLTWVERHFGQSIAQRYAGHTDSSRQATISVYTKATQAEVAQALSALTGEPHPLATAEHQTALLAARF